MKTNAVISKTNPFCEISGIALKLPELTVNEHVFQLVTFLLYVDLKC